MAEALLPLNTLDIAGHMAEIKALEAKARAYAKMGVPKIPGLPDIKEELRKLVQAEAKKLLEEVRLELVALILLVMSAGMAKLIELIPTINKVIKVLNKIIDAIAGVISFLVNIAEKVFIAIIGLTITFVVTKIITMIQSVAVAMGVGISLDPIKTAAQLIMNAAEFGLRVCWPIAYKIVAVLLMLMKMYGMLSLIMGIITMFSSQQTNATAAANDAFSRSADDWDNVSDDGMVGDGLGAGGGSGISDSLLVECKLPNGEVLKMTPENFKKIPIVFM